MHRFRKKSETKRSPVPNDDFDAFHGSQHESLPTLPPSSDFRTSLILPDLTRRFSVLRNSLGEPIGLDDLKHKFAEQRARGSENRVSEEEEDMILEALGRIHARTRSRGGDGRSSTNAESTFTVSDSQDGTTRTSAALSVGRSVLSASTSQASEIHGSESNASQSPKSSQYSRRMSNNLFGSGKFRDYTYIRGQRRGESTRTSTVTHSESNGSMNTLTSSKLQNGTSLYSDNQSLRPTTPDGSTYSPSNSVTSSPNKRVDTQEDELSIGSRFSKAMSPEIPKHASLALDEVIRELEEEGDDEIVMERSPITRIPDPRFTADSDPSGNSPQISPSEDDAGTALSSDEPLVSNEGRQSSQFSHSRTTSPTPRLPGYIPGMPRPMTPHESSFDSDDHTPSATPRATSPRLPNVLAQSPTLVHSFASSLQRSHSSASTARQLTPRPASPATALPTATSPLFLSRSTNGRFTPEDPNRSGSTSPGPEVMDSPVLGRRRPMSPLSGTAFQPLATVSSSSRPATPSNINWNVPSSPAKPRSSNGTNAQSGHSRNDSASSNSDYPADNSGRNHGDLDRSQSHSGARSLRSPALPDSPWIDNGYQDAVVMDPRAPSAMSNFELGPPRAPSRTTRSPTPTHSPTSPTFSENGSSTAVNGVSSKHSSSRGGLNTFSFGSTHALLLSPLGNSSRSSIESAGSSYHSWDEDHKRDRLFSLFSHLDPGQTDWHDISSADKSSPSTSGTSTSPYETTESEAIVKHDIGLSKNDFSSIQDKLVAAATAKAATPEGRHRAPSLRKRRPSTSQSNYSYNGGDSRVASPAPQSQQTPAASSSPRSANSDHIAKASALLDSVVDSIQSPGDTAATQDSGLQISTQIPTVQNTDPSPTARHRALADALFGVQDSGATPATPPQQPLTTSPPEKKLAVEMNRQRSHSRSESPISRPLGTPKPSPSMPNVASPYPSPSIPSDADGHGRLDPNSLAMDVQRRAEAATLALRKSPSHHKATEAFGSTRRRISPNQISSPKLMSASTSVDTIPLRPPTSASQTHPTQATTSTSKFGTRFRKLTGTLRSKPVIVGDDITPFLMDAKTSPTSPPTAQTLLYSPSQLAVPTISSAIEPRKFENSAPVLLSPPASSGPGLKGFMSRFRKSRAAEPVPILDRRAHSPSAATSLSPSSANGASSPSSSYAHSAPATKSTFSRSSRPISPQPQSFSPEPAIPEDSVAAPVDTAHQNDAFRQLFDAAGKIGLDQAALNDLIARSPSTSSNSTWAKTVRSNSVADTRKSRRNSSHPPMFSDGRPSVDTTATATRPSTEIRQLNIRKNTDTSARVPPPPEPRPQAKDAAARMVIRRTIILPDPKASNVDWAALARKQSTSRRRRSAGAGSTQSKGSVQDRVPTPPPNRATLKRFSNDSSPPMPHIQSFSSQLDASTSSQMEKSNSAYDSLYDMYDDRAPDPQGPSGSQMYQEDATGDGMPAVEVVELANGDTIWSIVNGLRDDDVESYFGGERASFASEYSARDEGVKISFKEHGRKSSKSSNNSLLGRKKPQGVNRPETKVFYSSSAQIGRLIENISRGADSGSFNIAPEQQVAGYAPVGHSASSSVGSDADMRWTVEERLEHMLGKIAADH